MQDLAYMPSPIHHDVSHEDSELGLRVQKFGGCVIARLSGKVDESNAPTLQKNLCILTEQGHLVVDLTGVTFMDAAALNALLVAYNRAEVLNTSIRLVGAQGPVRRVLDLTHMDLRLNHYENLGNAVEAALTAPDHHLPTSDALRGRPEAAAYRDAGY